MVYISNQNSRSMIMSLLYLIILLFTCKSYNMYWLNQVLQLCIYSVIDGQSDSVI